MSPTSTAFLIRPVRPDEYDALGELTVAAYSRVPHVSPVQDSYDMTLRDVATRAQAVTVLVAVTPAGELLGGVTYVPGPETAYSEDLREGEAGIRMLAVDPARQGHGVGRALTLACLELARAEGRATMALHTSEAMPAAVHLYESLGFVRDPERDWAPAPGVDLIGYSLALTAAPVADQG